MENRWRHVAGVLALALAVAFAPRGADAASDPVTHPDWARMMLEGLDLEEVLEFTEEPSQVFAVLSWQQSGWLDATEYIPYSDHGVDLERGTPALLRARADLGEVSFPVTVARAGEYGLRARMAGEPSTPVAVEVAPLRGGEGSSLTLVPARARGWIEAAKPLRLQPGAYRATLGLPQGAVFEQLELAPRCIAPIEPLGGWQTENVLDAEDLAVTLVRALDRERELPPAGSPVDATGADFVAEDGGQAANARLEGGTSGGRATVSVEVPVGGLYTLSAFGVRTTAQRWAADDCRTAVTCPLPSGLPTWAVVTTLPLSAGRHRFTVDLGPGDSVDRVRLERRQDAGPDYVAALRGMGFDPGDGPVSRETAEDALEWLGKSHRIELGDLCFEPGAGPEVQPDALMPVSWEEPITEPPATSPCQPPASPVVPEPCPSR